MNHKKAKDLIPEVASEMNLPLDLAEDLTSFYWSSIRKEVSSLDNIRIFIKYIGTLSVRSTFILDKEIKTLQKKIPERTDEESTVTSLRIKERIRKMELLKKEYLRELNDKHENYKLRKRIYESKQNMAKQEADSRGPDQLNPDQTGGGGNSQSQE